MPRALRLILAATLATVARLTRRVASGALTADAWRERMAAELKRHYAAALLAGQGGGAISAPSQKWLDLFHAQQLKYLRAFAGQVASDGYRPAFAARAAMYAGAAKAPYWHGRTKGLSLPAMPGDGSTQCLGNCGCAWDIVALEGDGNYDCYWKRGALDSCQTCVQRAADWAPLRVRGGEVGDEAPRTSAPDVQAMIRDKEDQLRPQRFESAYAVMPDGRVIIDKDGEKYAVWFSDEEISMMKGAILTHNHPRGWDVPADHPERRGNSFSKEDIELAAYGQLAEVRAITPMFRYSMKPPDGGWNAEYWEKTIKPAIDRYEPTLRESMWQAIRAGRITPEEASARHYHMLWSAISHQLGLEYTQEES